MAYSKQWLTFRRASIGSRTGIPTTTWNGDRYLEITVGGETLSPRELIRSVPIAGMALTVPDGAIGTSNLAENTATEVWYVERVDETSTISTDWMDMDGMALTITTHGGPIQINAFAGYRRTESPGSIVIRCLIDGIPSNLAARDTSSGLDKVSLIYITDLAPGTHTIKMQWKLGSGESGTLYTTSQGRQLSVVEYKR